MGNGTDQVNSSRRSRQARGGEETSSPTERAGRRPALQRTPILPGPGDTSNSTPLEPVGIRAPGPALELGMKLAADTLGVMVRRDMGSPIMVEVEGSSCAQTMGVVTTSAFSG